MVTNKVVFFVNRADYESAWTVTSTALTAAAMGEEVVLVFAFDALRALRIDAYGEPSNPAQKESMARGQAIGAATPISMLIEARGLGAKALACDTTVKLCGLDADRLVPTHLDEVAGLPRIWRLTAGARLLTF